MSAHLSSGDRVHYYRSMPNPKLPIDRKQTPNSKTSTHNVQVRNPSPRTHPERALTMKTTSKLQARLLRSDNPPHAATQTIGRRNTQPPTHMLSHIGSQLTLKIHDINHFNDPKTSYKPSRH
ncbi:hypothetical protein M758_12G081300 [Ceratodon purpureus]|nr:hypothetical protein M758_12G081300 [Ceratodon purpureus]